MSILYYTKLTGISRDMKEFITKYMCYLLLKIPYYYVHPNLLFIEFTLVTNRPLLTDQEVCWDQKGFGLKLSILGLEFFLLNMY
jgi:hypothetical protein